jgi:holo-ACP synthase CitX
MPSGASGADVLRARDAREALVLHWAGRAGGALVAVALNVPGADKAPPGARALHAWAVAEVHAALEEVRLVHASEDALGPFALLAVAAGPEAAKAACLAVEGARPAARLVDLDVYAPTGGAGLTPVDRASLGLPPRPCLLCDAPARECIRLGRHPRADVVTRALALLADALA